MIRNYRDATVWIADLVEPYLEDGKWKPGPSTFETVFLEWVHRSQAEPNQSTRESLLTADWYRSYSLSAPQAFDAVARRCATQLRSGTRLDQGIAEWAASVLDGTIARPREMHRPRRADWSEKALQILCAVEAVKRFGLRMTRNDESNHHLSASDAVAEAFTVCGRPTKYQQVKRLAVHPDHERFRDEIQQCIRFAAIVGADGFVDAIGLEKPEG